MRKGYYSVCYKLLFFVFSLVSFTYPQRYSPSYPNEISIPFISSQIIHFTNVLYAQYACVLRTSSNIQPDENEPAGYYEEINDWKYKISLTLKIKGENLVWNTPIEAVLIYQDGEMENVIINKETNPLYWYNFYNFDFDINYKKKGWVTIELYPIKEWNSINVPNVRFVGTKFRLE